MRIKLVKNSVPNLNKKKEYEVIHEGDKFYIIKNDMLTQVAYYKELFTVVEDVIPIEVEVADISVVTEKVTPEEKSDTLGIVEKKEMSDDTDTKVSKTKNKKKR